MIAYHAQYIFSCKLSMITYYVFSVKPIFLAQGFHSDHNCLIYHNVFVLDKTGYKNTNPYSDHFYTGWLK